MLGHKILTALLWRPTYGIVVSTFSVLDKDDKEKYFEESFLLADIKLNVVPGMPFLTMSNADVDF